MSEPPDNPDSVKTYPKEYCRAARDPPKSALYLQASQSARAYESKRWQELLTQYREENCCMGCNFLNVSSECASNMFTMADTAQELYGDVLTIRAVKALTTGSKVGWRITASLADRRWLSETSDNHVLLALYKFVHVRSHGMAAICNLVQETDVFGVSSLVLDLIPPERCQLCRVANPEPPVGGLLPAGAVEQVSPRVPAAHAVERKSSSKATAQAKVRKNPPPAPTKEEQPLPEQVSSPASAPASKELSKKRMFNNLATGASDSWSHAMRRSYMKYGFYIAYIRVPEGKKTAAMEVADRVLAYEYPSWPPDCKAIWDYEINHLQPRFRVWNDPRSVLDPEFEQRREKAIATQQTALAAKGKAAAGKPAAKGADERFAPVDREKLIDAYRTEYARFLSVVDNADPSTELDVSGPDLTDPRCRETLSPMAMEVKDLVISYLDSWANEECVQVKPLDAQFITTYAKPIGLFQGRVGYTEDQVDPVTNETIKVERFHWRNVTQMLTRQRVLTHDMLEKCLASELHVNEWKTLF